MPDSWLERHTAEAPEVLRRQVLRHSGEAARRQGESRGAGLAQAGESALRAALTHPARDRTAALDLLAADALITLGLLAQAKEDPGRFEAFAVDLLRSTAGPA